MKRPNFFIVGAPKCGTSSMSFYLGRHPNVFFCEPKEPHYFASDLDPHRPVKDIDAYLKLFKSARSQHLRIGEGSVFYLYSEQALINIKSYNPQAKIIVMLRKPADMVYSMHQQFLHALFEDEPDFRKAWKLQSSRERGKNIPRLCWQPKLLLYGKLAMFSCQIERLQSIFPASQIKIILFDQFAMDPAAIYYDTINFLDLPDDRRDKFPKINEGQTIRWGLGPVISKRVPIRIRNLVRFMRFNPLLSFIPAIADRLLKDNQKRIPLEPAFYNELIKYFERDVEKLARLIKQDLTHWNQLNPF